MIPFFTSSLTRAVSDVSQNRSVLNALGPRPDHEAVDTSKAKLAAIFFPDSSAAVGGWNLIHVIGFILLSVLHTSETCLASVRNFGKLSLGFEGAQMNWIDNDGLFLLSNQSDFAFGFVTTQDVTLFMLCVMHMDSRKIVWTANRGSPVSNSDKFVFDDKGSVSLQKGGSVVWSIDTGGKTVTAMD